MSCTCGKNQWVPEESLRDPAYEDVSVLDSNGEETTESRRVGDDVLFFEICRICQGSSGRSWTEREYS